MTLAEAAAELGLDTSTLRRQIGRGSLRAKKVGPVWTVTRYEVARYKAEHLRGACSVTHPDLGRCVVKGPHGGPDAPHLYRAVDAGA